MTVDVFKVVGSSKKWGPFGEKQVTVMVENFFIRDEGDWVNLKDLPYVEVNEMSGIDYDSMQTVQIIMVEEGDKVYRHPYIEPPRYPY